MRWRTPAVSYDPLTGKARGGREVNALETDQGEGYTLALVRMTGDSLESTDYRDRFAVTLYWRKQLLQVWRDIPNRKEDKGEAIAQAKATAEIHFANQPPLPLPSDARRAQHPG